MSRRLPTGDRAVELTGVKRRSAYAGEGAGPDQAYEWLAEIARRRAAQLGEEPPGLDAGGSVAEHAAAAAMLVRNELHALERTVPRLIKPMVAGVPCR